MEFDEISTDELSKLTKIQSHYRKRFIQNEMKKLRVVYENLFKEIEGDNTDVNLVWPLKDQICYPRFELKRSEQTKHESKLNENNITDHNESLSNQSLTIVSTNLNKKCLNAIQTNATAKSDQYISDSNTDTANKKPIEIVSSSIAIPKHDFENEENLEYLKFENLKTMNKIQLEDIKQNISLELLWIQQAIQSRVQYLKLKKRIENRRNKIT